MAAPPRSWQSPKNTTTAALDLIAQGHSRFEVLELNQERAFLRAEVLLLPDEPGSATPEDSARAIAAHQQIMTLAGAVQDLSAPDPATLSFHLAGSLPLDLDLKQKLLTMRSEAERVRTLATYFETILPNLRYAAQAREKSGGNGHAH